MSSGKSKSDSSLCEKSMKLVVNIIKMSSFSIAKMSLGIGPTDESTPLVTKNPKTVVTDQSQKTSQKLQSRVKSYSFVMQQADEGKGSRYVIDEGSSVIDGMASDYIRKFHEKNRSEVHLKDKSKGSPYKPSFPPRIVK